MWGGSGIPRASPAKQSGGTVGNSSKKKVSARLGYNICASGILWKREPDSFWGPSRTEAREGQGALRHWGQGMLPRGFSYLQNPSFAEILSSQSRASPSPVHPRTPPSCQLLT